MISPDRLTSLRLHAEKGYTIDAFTTLTLLQHIEGLTEQNKEISRLKARLTELQVYGEEVVECLKSKIGNHDEYKAITDFIRVLNESWPPVLDSTDT